MDAFFTKLEILSKSDAENYSIIVLIWNNNLFAPQKKIGLRANFYLSLRVKAGTNEKS
jgi:hypothetical protein